MPWIPIIICIGFPIAIILLFTFVGSDFMNSQSGMYWPAHELNNPKDPRIIRLNLDKQAVMEERSSGSGLR